jgi:putative NADPH-quinone reductase
VFDEKDDFYKLFKKVNKVDMIIYALSLYVDGMPSLLKNYFDRSVRRVYPFICSDTKNETPSPDLQKNQTMVALSICGFQERIQFKALDVHFKSIAHNFHIPMIETIYRPVAMFLFNNPFFYKLQTEVLDNMKKTGTELILTGKINKETKKNRTETDN